MEDKSFNINVEEGAIGHRCLLPWILHIHLCVQLKRIQMLRSCNISELLCYIILIPEGEPILYLELALSPAQIPLESAMLKASV